MPHRSVVLKSALITVLAAASLLLGTATTGPSAGAVGSSTTELNLCYQSSHGACVDGVDHEFDAYLPAGLTQKTPGVILVHGGSFVGGSKANFAAQGAALADAGIAAFSINYRLASPTFVGFPAQIQDVMAAVSYIRAHAGSFHVDSGRLGIWGASAGANLALEAALEAQQTDPQARVQAAVGWSGPYDFVTGYTEEESVVPGQVADAEEYAGCSNLTDPACIAIAQAASPTSWVQAGDPPTLLANSTNYNSTCEIVDPAQATELAGDLTAAGDSVTVHLNSECAHALAYANVEAGPTFAFLEAHLFVAPTIRSASAKRFRVGSATTLRVKSKADPTASLTELGGLPGGLTFQDLGNGDATISGTPQVGTEGTYIVLITAANGGSPDAYQWITLTVDPPRR